MMREMPDVDDQQPTPVYHTPTKPAAKILEEMVAERSSTKSSKSSSSHSNRTAGTESAATQSELPPLPPLPPSPPHVRPKSPSPPSFPSQPLESPLPPHPPSSHTDDVRNYRETSSTSRKSKHSSRSLPRRLLDELNHRHHHHHDPATETSPTDSHAGRHRYAESRSRASSDSISAIMALTTERLSRETTRANEAERQATEVLSMFKTAHEGKLKLERELQRVKEELAMYKIQLDVAQKEIFRAQEIVDKVERQRLAAEEDAMRAKEKMRKLVQTRAVEQAMEEGRRLGFEEGLNQGRVYGTDSVETAETWDEPFLKQSTRRPNGKGEHGRSEVSRHTYPNEESASGSSHSSGTKSIRTLPHHQRAGDTKLQATQASTSNSRPRRESTAIHSAIHSTYPQPPTSQATTSNTRPRGNSTTAPPLQHPHGTPPDVARYPQSLPMPTITTPMPVPVPSTQPQIPPPMPPHQSGTTIHDHSFKNPEHIKIQPSDKPIHPIPIHNHSPSVSHPSIVLPPDGYIPTLDANSMISLPPPHELSIPVPAEAPPLPPPQERSSTRPRSGSRGRESKFHVVNADADEHPSRHNPSRHGEFSDADSVAYTTRTGRDPDVQKYSHPTSHTMSVRSRGSTQLSELDMLSPPHGYEGDRSERNRARSRPDVESPTPVRSRPRASTQSATEGIAERWRNENRDYIRSKSPPESSGSRKDTTGRDSQTNGRDSRNQIERPTSAGSTVYGRPASSNGMRDNMRPRRPREVVLPVPLGDPFVDPSTAHGHASFPPRNNTPSSAGYGRPTIQTTFPPNAQRSTSTATVPGIEVVTPSTHTQSMHSVRTVVDPILLTPESANRATPLPEQHVDQRPDSGLGLFTPGQGEERIEMTLPDNNLPPGFVPLSPIPGMENLNPYPPGFAPTLPKDHPGGGSTNYTYSSPLVRPT